MTPFALFCIASIGSMVVAYVLSREARQAARALPRMVVTTGVVRELETTTTSTGVVGRRGYTRVEVDFVVDGKPYCCRILYLFAGNRHVGDVGKKFDFPPGQEVGVHYDPSDPRLNGLIIDTASYATAYIAVALAVVFAVMAAFTRL